MTFERVDGKYTQSDNPRQLVLHPESPAAYITANAVRAYFEGAEQAALYVDREYSQLGIEPGVEEGETYSLTRDDYSANLHVKNALRQLGVDPDGIEETWRFDLTRDEESELVVADFAELVEAHTDARHCPECAQRFAGERGLKSHFGRTHGEGPALREALKQMDPDEIGEPFPEDARADGGSR